MELDLTDVDRWETYVTEGITHLTITETTSLHQIPLSVTHLSVPTAASTLLNTYKLVELALTECDHVRITLQRLAIPTLTSLIVVSAIPQCIGQPRILTQLRKLSLEQCTVPDMTGFNKLEELELVKCVVKSWRGLNAIRLTGLRLSRVKPPSWVPATLTSLTLTHTQVKFKLPVCVTELILIQCSVDQNFFQVDLTSSTLKLLELHAVTGAVVPLSLCTNKIERVCITQMLLDWHIFISPTCTYLRVDQCGLTNFHADVGFVDASNNLNLNLTGHSDYLILANTGLDRIPVACYKSLNVNTNPIVTLANINTHALTSLDISYTHVSDLTPLKHSNLTDLNVESTPINDDAIAVFQTLVLVRLNLRHTGITHVTFLQPPLKSLVCNALSIEELAVLSTLPLDYIDFNFLTLTPDNIDLLPSCIPPHVRDAMRHRLSAQLINGSGDD